MHQENKMFRHFSRAAPIYRDVRTTDAEPVAFIADTLAGSSQVTAADVGCGPGRYDLLLFQHLKNLHLTCIDINEFVLKQLSDYLKNNGITKFKTIKANANEIPLKAHSMDCIFSFNAIHHFDFIEFIKQCGKVIKENGKIFIYTRLRSQNARNIWGQYFPFFAERETRLCEMDEMEQSIKSVGSLRIETTRLFKYKRHATIDKLLEQVRAKHYSTFCFYKEDELEKAVSTFQKEIQKHFQNTNHLEWFDENILLVVSPKQDEK